MKFKSKAEEEDKESITTPNRKRNSRLLMLGGIFLAVIAPFLLTRNIGLPPFTETGDIGDTIGGITSPIVGLLGAILVYYALLEQIEANRLINVQFKEQQKTTYRQNFEQTFFNMLNIHHEIVNNIEFNEGDLKVDLYFDGKQFEDKMLNLRITLHKLGQAIEDKEFEKDEHEIKIPASVKTYKGRDFFKYSSDYLKDIIYLTDNAGGLGKNAKKTEFVDPLTGEIFMSFFRHNYKDIFHQLDTYLGHYYRNLYRIIRMIDEKEFSDDEREDYEIKYVYTSIVRSQLSDYEIQWLFFNGLYDYGSNFKKLIQEYSLLKILRWNTDETIKKFKSQYVETAYQKVEWKETKKVEKPKQKTQRKLGHERTVDF
jgi:Putative phage abortive infection protein